MPIAGTVGGWGGPSVVAIRPWGRQVVNCIAWSPGAAQDVSGMYRSAGRAIVRLVASLGDEHGPGRAPARQERSAGRAAPAAAARSGAEPGARPDAQAERARELEQERLLCERAQKGDRGALAQLLRRYGPVLYRSVLLPRLGGEAAAQDALGDTYMRVVERFDQFEWRGCGVYPWLRVIAMHIALDVLRSRRRETLFDPTDLAPAIEQAERDADDGVDVQLCEQRDLEAARTRLEEALGSINQRYAQAIRMRVVEERSREEAARTLGVSVPTFDVVLHRALAALRRAIGTPEVEP